MQSYTGVTMAIEKHGMGPSNDDILTKDRIEFVGSQK